MQEAYSIKIFAHHVLGTGRGGIEEAVGYEWGGQNADGSLGFDTKRPGWEMPIHQLMAENNVPIFPYNTGSVPAFSYNTGSVPAFSDPNLSCPQ